MSAKNKAGSKSKKNDVYLTDPALALFLVEMALKREHPEWLESKGDGVKVLEPSAGEGAFVLAVRHFLPKCHVTCIELRSACEEVLGMRGCDTLYISSLERIHKELDPSVLFDLIIGNPPYTHAIKHTKICLSRLVHSGKLWFLLRHAINNSEVRLPFWEANPTKYQSTLVQRASFTGKGSDQTEHTLFEWQRGFVWPDGWERTRRLSWR